MILATLLLASSSAARAMPSFEPRNTTRVGTSTSEPPSPADADTANEIDDLLAITRMLKQERFDVVALNSTQWRHYLSEEHMRQQGLPVGTTTVGASQRFNEELCGVLQRDDLPLPLGSIEPTGRPWGGSEPKNSAAARAIVREAHATPAGQRLRVVCLGATTNLASAIALDPTIAPRIEAEVLGFRFDAERGVWDKNSFNVRRDLNAADFLLNTEGLRLTVMPANVAGALRFDRDDSWRRGKPLQVGAYLTRRWRAKAADFPTWVMWDLALVEAILHPEMAEITTVTTPPENAQREIRVYTGINAEAMRADYWRAVLP